MSNSVVVRYCAGAPVVRDSDLEKFVSRVMAAAGLEQEGIFVVGNWPPLLAVRLVVAGRGLDRNMIRFEIQLGPDGLGEGRGLEDGGSAEGTEYWEPSQDGG